MRRDIPISSATCFRGCSLAVTACKMSTSRGVSLQRAMNAACSSSCDGAVAATLPASKVARSRSFGGRRNHPAPMNVTITHTKRRSEAIITTGTLDWVMARDAPEMVNAHKLFAARPIPAHSCGVCMRGASCRKMVVKNVTKKPELR